MSNKKITYMVPAGTIVYATGPCTYGEVVVTTKKQCVFDIADLNFSAGNDTDRIVFNLPKNTYCPDPEDPQRGNLELLRMSVFDKHVYVIENG